MSDYDVRVQQLRERYPYQFARLFTFGLSIEPGWIGIIEAACAQVDAALEAGHVNRATFSWLQIKEKLGTLRMAWDRAWDLPSARSDWFDDDEPELVFPEVMPEDPAFDPGKETFEEYLASDRAREWDAKHMIPNPALAERPRVLTRDFDGIVDLDFDAAVSDEEIEITVRAVASTLLVPEDVTIRIRAIRDAAEDEAARTCQFCGAPGRHLALESGWLVIACETHSTRASIVEFHKQSEAALARFEKLRQQAALCALAGDTAGAEQNLAASQVPSSEWAAAKSGKLDY